MMLFTSGSCFLQLWDHGAALHPCKCPLCRRETTLLVPSEASSGQNYTADVAEILQRIERYNRLYGEHSTGLMQVTKLYIVHYICCRIECLFIAAYSFL